MAAAHGKKNRSKRPSVVPRLLLEGGGDILGQLRDLQLIDELWCFITPLLTGGDKPSFAGAGVAAVSEAFFVHLGDHRADALFAFWVALRQEG